MKLIGLMFLLPFCSHFRAAPINVTSELSVLIRRIIWTDWNQFNIELNPDSILDTPEMVRKAGYLVESYVVTTEDGYLLTLHRIPGGNDSLPVLLQHGFLGSSADWLVLGKGKALGTTSFFIMASERPKIAKMVEMMISLAPAVFTDYMQSPIQYLIPFKNVLKMVMQLFFHDEFLGDSVRFLLKDICDQNIEFCSNIMSMICGDDREQFNNPEMIRKAGYPVEAHVIKTEDGYLLTLHRIPGGNDSLPVLLLHGLTASSSKWLIPGKDKAFHQEYDVWLGNFRYYQLEDTYFPISVESDILGFQIKFFNSFDEIDIYDVSAMVTFITNLRSQPLHTCIGHSMGTTCFYIMASERPEIARMVKMMINFGPVVFLNHIQSPILGSHQEND
ncbi:uncharacterized protein LOC105255041 isoform X2 [Camponotus floridanus]|uniref:uncharacterized protein LOC105255041 isoform X2 n=1 Tax=Camponotus floridanus TaxID=104421 RepID=UPI000DC664DF|nr:uncharacterized protein LOC105255041 isoform X2 [Camponotus floridanus]